MQHMDPTDFRAVALDDFAAAPLPRLAQRRDGEPDAEAVTDEDDDELDDEDDEDDDEEDEEQAGTATEETGTRRRGTGDVA